MYSISEKTLQLIEAVSIDNRHWPWTKLISVDANEGAVVAVLDSTGVQIALIKQSPLFGVINSIIDDIIESQKKYLQGMNSSAPEEGTDQPTEIKEAKDSGIDINNDSIKDDNSDKESIEKKAPGSKLALEDPVSLK